MSAKTQVVVPKSVLGGGWTEFEVLSKDYSNDLSSRTTVRTPDDSPFIDISIEEYTGLSRRAKLASVRLHEEAARRLYEALKAKFSKDIP